MKVAVLGTGPEGLIAAHAVREFGCDLQFFGLGRMDYVHGVQYINQHVPGVTTGAMDLIGHVLMTEDTELRTPTEFGPYHQKAGGTAGIVPGQGERDQGHLYRGDWREPAWNIRAAYATLWDDSDLFKRFVLSSIWTGEIHPQSLFVTQTLSAFDLVISTLPRHCWARCEPGVVLEQRAAWVSTDTREHPAPLRTEFNTVIYDSSPGVGFYRAANIFGVASVEWPGEKPKPPVDGVLKMIYPTTVQFLGGHEKPELPFRLEHVGQYAEWSEEINPGSVFFKTHELLRDA